jgi:hypothetical protein
MFSIFGASDDDLVCIKTNMIGVYVTTTCMIVYGMEMQLVWIKTGWCFSRGNAFKPSEDLTLIAG